MVARFDAVKLFIFALIL